MCVCACPFFSIFIKKGSKLIYNFGMLLATNIANLIKKKNINFDKSIKQKFFQLKIKEK